MPNKELLFISQMHGDEWIGTKSLNELHDEGYKFNWIIGNQKAADQNKRFVDTDLNRVAPGDLNSEIYEEKRAAEILKEARNFQKVIDIHGSTSQTGIFIIITKLSKENLEFAKTLPIENVVFWEGKKKSGPPTQFMKCALEIECGPRDLLQTKEKLKEILRMILSGESKIINQKYYKVAEPIQDAIDKPKLKEFEKIEIEGKEIIPFMIQQYNDKFAYNLEELNISNIQD